MSLQPLRAVLSEKGRLHIRFLTQEAPIAHSALLLDKEAEPNKVSHSFLTALNKVNYFKSKLCLQTCFLHYGTHPAPHQALSNSPECTTQSTVTKMKGNSSKDGKQNKEHFLKSSLGTVTWPSELWHLASGMHIQRNKEIKR